MHTASIIRSSKNGAVLWLTVLLTTLATIQPANGQAVSERILRQFQPRGMQALHRTALSKAAAKEAAILKQRQYHVWDGTDWQLQGQSVFTYENVRRTEQWDYIWTGASWQNASRTTYTWTDATTLVETSEEYNSDTQVFDPSSRYIYAYVYDFATGDLHLSSTVTESYFGGEWTPIDRITYTGATVTIAEALTETWNGQDWDLSERYRMEDKPFGVRQTDESWTGSGWVPTFQIEYYGIRTDEMYEIGLNLLAALADYGFLLYGLHEFPPYAQQMWNGSEWVNIERGVEEVTDPDPVNDLSFTVQLRQVFEDGEWVNESRLHTTHRSDGKPVLVTVQNPDNDFWLTSLREVYEYDSRNDVTRATQEMEFGEGLENTIQYRLTWDRVTVKVDKDERPDGYALDAAYPNPFNPETTITYRLAAPGHVTVRAYDMLGRLVASLFEGNQTAGTHEVAFRAADLSSGVYLIRMEAPGFQQARSVTLLK